MMAFLVQLILNKIISFVKKLHKILTNQWVDAFMWTALLCVDPLLYYVPTVDSQNLALHVNYSLLITILVLYLPLVACRIYRCAINRKSRLIIISAETCILVFNHAVWLWSLLFRPAMEIPSPLSVTIMFVAVGAYLGRASAVFKWFTDFASQIRSVKQRRLALWLLACIIYFYGGYIFGSFWYYLAIRKKIMCWNQFSPPNFIVNLKEREILIKSCSANPHNEVKLGIFKDAFVSGIIEHDGLWQRVFMCLGWGMQTMCTFASANANFNSSYGDELELAFMISVAIYAIVTIGLSISNLCLAPQRISRHWQFWRARTRPRRLYLGGSRQSLEQRLPLQREHSTVLVEMGRLDEV